MGDSMARIKSIWIGKSYYIGDKEDEKITLQVDLERFDTTQGTMADIVKEMKRDIDAIHELK